jgi:hypothetical protein
MIIEQAVAKEYFLRRRARHFGVRKQKRELNPVPESNRTE